MTETAPAQGPLEPMAVSDLEGPERSSTSLQYMARRERGLWDAGHLTTLFSVTDQAARRTNINRAVMDLWKQTDPSLRQASDLPALTDGQKRDLFSLLFSVLEETHSKTGDTIRLFWEGLLGETTPGRTYLSIVTAQGREFLTEWIGKLERERTTGLSPGFFRGVRVYLGEQGNSLDAAAPALHGLLEDPDSFVRANVGRRWAYLLSRESPRGGWKKAIQILSETELQFPGALAPFLSTMLNADKRASQPGGVFAKSREDLVDVLCRRQVPETEHPPFELLETFLARHVAGNSELLRRLLQAGFGRSVLIALQGFGSKDTRHEFFPELARDPDERIARDACMESIRDGIPLPENAQERGLAKRFEGPGIVVTVIRHDAGGQAYDWLYAVLSPVDTTMWSLEAAWRAVDAMLPPGVRGDEQRIHQFPRGPEVTFGLNWPDRDEYEYIEIKGIGVLDIWDPEKCIRSLLG